MGRTPSTISTEPREALRMRVTMTESGYPAPPNVIADMYHGRATAAADGGWWWTFATPASATSIRRHGHLAVGTVTTSFAPPEYPLPGEYVEAVSGSQRRCATCGGEFPCTGHTGPERRAGGRRGMGPCVPGEPGTDCACGLYTAVYGLARRIGPGFHPDTPGDAYTSLPDGVTPELIDATLNAAVVAGTDVYAAAVEAVSR